MTEKEDQKNTIEFSTEELKQLVEQDKADRLLNCKREIDAALQKHKCRLIALPRINAEGRTIAEVQLQIL